ncbi:MAG TPA: MG2 domain-containing protein [Candidatus Binatia bacterium]|nr:MG2 domain-containing protein [Candidatus Binatia bacterium]
MPRTRKPTGLRILSTLPGAMLLLVASALSSAATTIEMFSPQGHTLEARQVVARFSEPMVAFGDLRDTTMPFTLDCSEKGKARWIDGRTWAFDFERTLPGGIRCSFRVRADLRDLAGKTVDGETEFAFHTGGPSVTEIDPRGGSVMPATPDTPALVMPGQTIAEDQAFLVHLNAEADPASIPGNVWFQVDGLPERVEAELMAGAEREALLASLSQWRRPRGAFVVLKARRTFPNDRTVTLVWGAGVRTTGGIAGVSDYSTAYRTRKDFDVDVRCTRENARADCNPVARITLDFQGSVPWRHARGIELVSPGGQARRAHPPAYQDDDARDDTLLDSVSFPGPFEEGATYSVRLPQGFADDSGRTLTPERAASLLARTAPYPPLVKFAARFGVLESKAAPALPVTLRNVEAELAGMQAVLTPQEQAGWMTMIGRAYDQLRGQAVRVPADDPARMLYWLQRLSSTQRARSIFEGEPEQHTATALKLPRPSPQKEMEVVGIPLREPGLYVVELVSPRLGASHLGVDLPMYVPAAALVTNLAVHFKKGVESSLVWVTRLDDAAPVPAAHVTLHDCQGNQLADVVTDDDGIARVQGFDRYGPATCDRRGAVSDAPVKDAAGNPFVDEHGNRGDGGLDSLSGGVFVVARSAGDIAFVHSSWDDGIEPWRLLPHANTYGGGTDSRHTILDRSLFRPGETVHMKHVLRLPVMSGFTVPAADKRPHKARVVHDGSEQSYDQDITWDENGIATTDWTIPAGARLGTYSVRLVRTDGIDGWSDWNATASFRIEQFRVPLMRASVGLPAKAQVAPSSLPVEVSSQYLSGGAADDLPFILRSELRPGAIDAPPDFEQFTFAAGSARVGIERETDDYSDDEEMTAPKLHQERRATLDASGTARAEVTELPATEEVRELVAEVEYRDPNGERQTTAATTTLWPAARVAGIHVENWLDTDAQIESKVAVLDTDRKPVAGAAVTVELLHRRSYWSRTRQVGGFYGYQGSSETRAIGPLCQGATGADGVFACSGKPPSEESVLRGGHLILQATTTDEQGRKSVTHTSVYVPGRDTSFPVEPSDRVDVVPERKEYEPGQTARLQVRMPFQKATALVVVEREGTGEARVVELSGDDPVVEVPVLASYAPNIFVSVLLVRGRIGEPAPTALLDLGRPAFRMGAAELRIGRSGHRLDVRVEADRPSYRVRETAKVRVKVRASDGNAPGDAGEVALAAVDEGLLELDDNQSWDLLEAMMGERAYQVSTATGQSRVVGKRHSGRKAIAAGGGGGGGSTRELFDTLLLWKARVPLDAAGDATVEVPLNDSLTSFRIVAIATAGSGQFGTGSTSIRSTQDLMMLPGLPPLVRAGDAFSAELTLRNTTSSAMDVEVGGVSENSGLVLPPRRLHLEPAQSVIAEWPLVAPAQTGELLYRLTAKSPAGSEDSLLVRQQVAEATAAATLQSSLLHYQEPIVQRVQRPVDAIAGSGGIEVAAAQSLSGGLAEVRAFLERYPYTCLEQRISIAVGLGDEARWQKVLSGISPHIDADGLLRFFPEMNRGSEVLTAYVLALAHAAGWPLPDDLRAQMIAGLTRFVEGNLVRDAPFAVVDLPLRKLQVIEALARAGEAKAFMLQSIAIEPARWPTSALLDWWSIVHRIKDLPERDTRLQEAERLIRARLDFAGTLVAFRGEERSDLWWLMRPDDMDDVRLLALLAELDLWRDDMPAIARGALASRHKGAWKTTVSNAWGMAAMRAFDQRFGAEPLRGQTSAVLAGVRRSHDWVAAAAAHAVLWLPWPAGAEDLRVEHRGEGGPWVTITSRAAIPLREPLTAGYTIAKSVTRIEGSATGALQRGDRLRVRLDIDAQAQMTWVVIEDPVPAGASHLATGLGRRADVGLAQDGDADLDTPTYTERTFASYRAYFEYMPAGRTSIEYTIRLNQAGVFQLPPTRVEALYAPERFAALPNATMEVEP